MLHYSRNYRHGRCTDRLDDSKLESQLRPFHERRRPSGDGALQKTEAAQQMIETKHDGEQFVRVTRNQCTAIGNIRQEIILRAHDAFRLARRA